MTNLKRIKLNSVKSPKEHSENDESEKEASDINPLKTSMKMDKFGKATSEMDKSEKGQI